MSKRAFINSVLLLACTSIISLRLLYSLINQPSTEINQPSTTNDCMNYSICENYPNIKDIIFASHHKAGTNLLRSIRKDIDNYYESKCEIQLTNVHKKKKKKKKKKKNFISEFSPGHINEYEWNNSSHNKILFHMIRNPVYMVLSGYNFHKSVSVEQWTHTSSINHLYRLKHRVAKRFSNFYNCWIRLFYENDENNMYYNKYMMNNSVYYTYTIQYMLNNVFTISEGLLWEYDRFVCNEAVNMLESYLFVKKLNRKPHIFANNMRLASFENDFNGTCIKMIDALGICEYSEKHLLMQQLIRHDQSSRGLTHHATKGLYNKQQQINMLLNNIDRCLYIRNLTIALDMKWEFAVFC